MSTLDDAMLAHISYIVLSESRPFSYADFLSFDVDGEHYEMAYGTVRNKISRLKKQGKIEPAYYSIRAFYTLKGSKFGKPMTPDHTVVHNDPVYNMIHNLPMDKQSIHDIHLKFKAPNIYKIFSDNTPYPIIEKNKAISIPSWSKNNAIVKITINKNDTVTVIIGCSLEPIPLDYNGILRFFTILVRAEGLLEGLTSRVNNYKLDQSIPQYGRWIITRWDFGRDASQTYKGEKYEITVENAQQIFARIYTKDFGKYKKIRLERVECPRKSVLDAIQEKLNENFQT
jgi:hypothetical protein